MAQLTTLGMQFGDRKKERLEARVSADQKQLIQHAAELRGLTLTDFIVSSAHEAALKTIEDMRIISLAADESRAFADAIATALEPSERLRAAARRYTRMASGSANP